MRPSTLRAMVVAVVFGIVVVAAVPLLVLLDLAGGGSGLGVCPQGLEGCRASLYSGPRLILVLVGCMIALIALLRLVVFLVGRLRRRHEPSL